jgi:hypothetical protein
MDQTSFRTAGKTPHRHETPPEGRSTPNVSPRSKALNSGPEEEDIKEGLPRQMCGAVMYNDAQQQQENSS